ncbi:MAG: polysaccharide deacetylase family protein [Flavobacteriales bacterium]|nr:polysaccharide deacetylase family protein [Flavobacteriales bacterium]
MLTNDVETHSIWYNRLRDETGEKVLTEGMPILLDLYAKYNVKSTFYFTGYIANLYPDVVKMIIKDGHEVASHGYSHEVNQAFDVLSALEQFEHLKKSKDLLEQISGQEVISFRAPALRVNEHTANALIEAGFKIDSSVASQRFDMFLSFGGLKKLNWLNAPRMPYRVDANDIFKKGKSGLVEVPLSALGFPYVGTTMRLFPLITAIQRHILHAENAFNNKPIVFGIHPNEFLEEGNGNRTIHRRSKNYIKYLLMDVLRGKMKIKNLGRKAIPLYEREIEFYHKLGYEFITVKDYCKNVGLIS